MKNPKWYSTKTKTKVGVINDSTVVKYHDTNVVRFSPKQIILTSGGWRTRSTKDRMNQVSSVYGLNYTIRQEKYKWFVYYKNKKIPFKDGMILKR